jgi:hypothetical protein
MRNRVLCNNGYAIIRGCPGIFELRSSEPNSFFEL